MTSATTYFIRSAAVGGAIGGWLLAAILAVLLSGAGGMLAKVQAMSTDLARVSTRLNSLEKINGKLANMNAKLSTTNALLRQTNSSLASMIGTSRSADEKLSVMQNDIAVMSHKLAGSFLFRGVK